MMKHAANDGREGFFVPCNNGAAAANTALVRRMIPVADCQSLVQSRHRVLGPDGHEDRCSSVQFSWLKIVEQRAAWRHGGDAFAVKRTAFGFVFFMVERKARSFFYFPPPFSFYNNPASQM